MNGKVLDKVLVEKDLGIMISSDVKSSQQYVVACNKANTILGMIRRTISYKERWMMVNLYKSTYWAMCKCMCGLVIIRRIKNYWKECNIDLQEWLKVFDFSVWRETLEVRFVDAWREKKSMWFNRSVLNVLRLHWDNTSATRELSVCLDSQHLRHECHTTYLGVTLDRTLSSREHLTITGKLKNQNNLLMKLAGST